MGDATRSVVVVGGGMSEPGNRQAKDHARVSGIPEVVPRCDRDDVLAILSAAMTATDRRDHEAKHRFFTADAVMRHGDGEGTEVRGLEALAANTKRVAEHFTTMHALSNWDIAVDGDEAQAVSHAIAHVLDERSPRMLIRGLRYDDRLVRTDAGWRIAERRHNLLWQLEVDAATPRSLFEYLP